MRVGRFKLVSWLNKSIAGPVLQIHRLSAPRKYGFVLYLYSNYFVTVVGLVVIKLVLNMPEQSTLERSDYRRLQKDVQ